MSLEEGSISACLCTSPLCNSGGEEGDQVVVTTGEPKVLQEIIINLSEAEEKQEKQSENKDKLTSDVFESVEETEFSRVICHQCGSLLSGTNPECGEFLPGEPAQEGFCQPGEVSHHCCFVHDSNESFRKTGFSEFLGFLSILWLQTQKQKCVFS